MDSHRWNHTPGPRSRGRGSSQPPARRPRTRAPRPGDEAKIASLLRGVTSEGQRTIAREISVEHASRVPPPHGLGVRGVRHAPWSGRPGTETAEPRTARRRSNLGAGGASSGHGPLAGRARAPGTMVGCSGREASGKVRRPATSHRARSTSGLGQTWSGAGAPMSGSTSLSSKTLLLTRLSPLRKPFAKRIASSP